MPAPIDAIVEVRGISKIYGDAEALRGIDLDFPRGKLTSLLGPSGCGKTTLLKIIAGLVEADAGTIAVDGKTVSGPGPERAFVFQDFALMPWATVLRNVAFGLELRGMAKAEREEIARHYIAEVGLAGFEDKYPHELSGGMRQRVGLARALAVDADVLLLDEPFSAVDEQNRRKFQEDLIRLRTNQQQDLHLRHPFDRGGGLHLRPHRAPVAAAGPGFADHRAGHRPLRRPRAHPPRQALSRYGRGDLAGAQAICGLRPGMTLFGYRVPMMASLLVWCVLWEIVGRLDLIFLLPPFSEVLAAAVDLVQTPSWQSATVTTLRAFVIGMALSIVVGVPLGILMGRVKIADELLGMWVNIFSSAPLSALVPVLMILFGFGEKTIVAAVFLFAIWIIVLDTRAGVRHISPSLIEMARSYGATRRALYVKIILWAALPEILAGIRLGLIRGVKGVVIGQLLVAIVGYGALFETFSRNFRMAEFWALTIILFAFALLIAELIERARSQGRILRRSKTMTIHRRGRELRHRTDRTSRPFPWRSPTRLFPVHRVYCVGRNYAAHAVEMGHDPNKEPPFFFQKNPDNLDTERRISLSAGLQRRPSRDRDGRGAEERRQGHPGRKGARLRLRLWRRPRHDAPRPAGKGQGHGPPLGGRQGVRSVGALLARWCRRARSAIPTTARSGLT